MRKHLSYANVAASVALFLALAGGTTAIALRGAGGGDKQRAGVLTSRITGFTQDAEQCGAVSGVGATVGCSPAADPPWQLSPATRYAATGLSVELTDPSVAAGASRTFGLVVDQFPPSALSCTVEPNESTCRNKNARVTVPRGSQLLIYQTAGNGSVLNTDAMVSFRLARP